VSDDLWRGVCGHVSEVHPEDPGIRATARRPTETEHVGKPSRKVLPNRIVPTSVHRGEQLDHVALEPAAFAMFRKLNRPAAFVMSSCSVTL
jgi:hypothetical protein